MADVPDGMAEFLARKYAILQQAADPAPVKTTAARAPDLVGNLKANPFAGMKDGSTRDFRSFNANQTGGMTIISGTGSPIGSMQSLVQQGWKPADAVSAVSTEADVGLTGAKTKLLPAESLAQIARLRAASNLDDQNARVVVPESQARVAAANAGTMFTNTQNRVLARTSLAPENVVYGDDYSAAWDAINRSAGLASQPRRRRSTYRLGTLYGED